MARPWLGRGSAVVRLWFGRGSAVVRPWFGRGWAAVGPRLGRTAAVPRPYRVRTAAWHKLESAVRIAGVSGAGLSAVIRQTVRNSGQNKLGKIAAPLRKTKVAGQTAAGPRPDRGQTAAKPRPNPEQTQSGTRIGAQHTDLTMPMGRKPYDICPRAFAALQTSVAGLRKEANGGETVCYKSPNEQFEGVHRRFTGGSPRSKSGFLLDLCRRR